MSPLSPFSPTMTSTSTSSRPRTGTDIDNLPELDIADPMDMMDGLEGVGVPDINDLFNFDEYESANDSHSATTASPNRTPSPLLAPHSPVAIASTNSPSFTYNQDVDFSFDSFEFMNPKELDNAPAGPSSFPITPAPLAEFPIKDDIVVKQEPVDMWAEPQSSEGLGIFSDTAVHVQATPATMPAMALDSAINAQPDLINFNGLPLDQQQALQQLMFNIMAYQGKFGFDMAAQQPVVPVQPTTIEPSMLFSNTTSSSSSQAGLSSFVSPNPVSGLPSTGASPFSNNAVAGPSSAPSTSNAVVDADIDDEDQLVSIEPHEQPSRSVRADSSFSAFGDIDTRLDRLAPLSSIFSAGKGKGGKKGGGLSSVVRQEDEDVDDDDSWRPSPEEYKKLSSKEKRQLRNKLSARAFRNRRKDYIGTLEGHIRERDGVIDEMKAELGASRSENQDLRKELAALKASTMGILHPQSAADNASPAILQAFAMSSSLPAAAASQAKKPAPIPVFNPRKDIGIDSKTRWGNENLFGGGSTICHTVLTTDTAKPAIAPFAMPRSNLNPRLAKIDKSNEIANLASSANGRELGSAPFADWAENNAWSIRSMDSYRMQMWGRLAREAAADKAGLVGDLRPKFFTEPSSPKEDSPVHQATTAAVKIATSFWSAFQTPSSKVDTDKLTAVVTGQTRIRGNQSQSRLPDDDLIAALGGLRLQAGKEAGWRERNSLGVREDPLRALGGLFGLGMMPTRA